MSNTLRWILIGLLAALVAIQFVGPPRPAVSADNPNDLFIEEDVDEHVANLIRTACYDCHSMETKFPWYASVAPVSWRVYNHINHGREELNFSDWGEFKKVRKIRKLKDIAEVIEEGEMPLNDYVLMHSDADLSDADREAIVNWANSFARDVMSAE